MAKKPMGNKVTGLPDIVHDRARAAYGAVELTAHLYGIKRTPLSLLEEYRHHRGSGVINPSYAMSQPALLLADLERLDEAAKEIQDFDPEKYTSARVFRYLGSRGGNSKFFDEDLIKQHIKEILAQHKGPETLKGTQIMSDLILRMREKPIPGKSMLYRLIKQIKNPQ